MKPSYLSRRKFVQLSAFSVGAVSIGFSSSSQLSSGMTVVLVRDPRDPVAVAPCVTWAMKELGQALEQHGFKVRQVSSFDKVTTGDFCLVAAASFERISRNLPAICERCGRQAVVQRS
jgi:hypothetical protein